MRDTGTATWKLFTQLYGEQISEDGDGRALSSVRQVTKPTKFIALTKPARFHD